MSGGEDDRSDEQHGVTAGGPSSAERTWAPASSDAPTELGLEPSAESNTEPSTEPDMRPATRGLADPTWPQIGRYRLRDRLGKGAMGVVFEALDPSLDRAVAVKVLHAEMPAAARLRMQREATALARLSHPNVVQVYEVGEADGRTFIAMELVRGQTLADWAQRKPRPTWRECLEVYVQAGTGLAAAHAAGLVHRDFKPSNCIMGEDGRVRVVDFGLAKDTGEDDPEPTSEDHHPAAEVAAKVALTQHGALLGTPAYMAPEQLAGRPGSPASDQLSLCVSLWEALYGQRPFTGDTLPELTVSILEGRITEPPAGTEVPRWLRAIVQRGMDVDPERRWPSAQALVDALQRGRARARWQRLLWAAGLVAVAAGAIVTWQRVDEHARTRACEAAGQEIATIWSDEAAATMREAMMSTGVAWAPTTADKVIPWLDAQAHAWASARTEACLQANVRGTWDAPTFERAQWCLDERRYELEALVTELHSGRASAIEESVNAAVALQQVEPCVDPRALARQPIPPTEAREAVEAVRAELSHVGALHGTGDYEQALTLAREALEHADALAWPPLGADARMRLAALHVRQGRYAEAERVYEDAFFMAAKADAAELATYAAGRLVFVVGYKDSRPAVGLSWSRQEELWLSRFTDQSGLWRASMLQGRGSIFLEDGRFAEAKELLEKAFELEQSTLEPDHPHLVTSMTNLGNLYHSMGDYERSKDMRERALATLKASLGPDHPDISSALNNLGTIHAELGDYDQAMALTQQAIELDLRVLGPDHPILATHLENMSGYHQAQGDIAKAVPLLERTLEIYESMDSESPRLATTLSNLAVAHSAMGDPAKAVELLERALRIREATKGPEHPDVASTLSNLASAQLKLGDRAGARASTERALAIQEATLGPDHPKIGGTLINLANGWTAEGDYAKAEELLLRALALFEGAMGSDHPHVALCQVNLAGIYRSTDRLEQARQSFERAAEIWERAFGPTHPHVAIARMGFASVAVDQGRAAEAIAPAEAAVEILESATGDPTDLAMARFELARALWAAGRDRARAHTLAEQARDMCRERANTGSCAPTKIESWLATH